MPKRKRGRPSNASKIAEAHARAAAGLPPRVPKARRNKKAKTNDAPGTNIESWTSTNASRPAEPRPRPVAATGRRNIPQATSGPITNRQPRQLSTSPAPERPRPAIINLVNRRDARAAGDDLESDDDDDGARERDEDEPPSPEKPYTHVAPLMRRIRPSTIQSKWTPLGQPSLVTLTNILQLAQRPIMQRQYKSAARRTHTQDALNLVAKRIAKKISKSDGSLPFPPSSMIPQRGRGSGAPGRPRTLPDGGREAELNFESVLDAKQALERQLDPALHSVELLTQERDRLEAQLEDDYKMLTAMEDDMRAQARQARSLLKKSHPLAPEVRESGEAGSSESVTFQPVDAPTTNPFSEPANMDVAQLIPQLANHVSSLQTHFKQTDHILPEIARAKATLQDVLSRHLDADTYQQVILGP